MWLFLIVPVNRATAVRPLYVSPALSLACVLHDVTELAAYAVPFPSEQSVPPFSGISGTEPRPCLFFFFFSSAHASCTLTVSVALDGHIMYPIAPSKKQSLPLSTRHRDFAFLSSRMLGQSGKGLTLGSALFKVGNRSHGTELASQMIIRVSFILFSPSP